MGAAIALQKLALAYLMKGDIRRALTTAREAIQASASHGPEMCGQAQELLRKIEDSSIVPPGAAPPKTVKTFEELVDDMPLMDRTMFPARAAIRPANRQGRTNIDWATIGR